MSNRYVILDGPRGSGKSTTCQMVVDELNRLGVPSSYYKKGARVENDEYSNMVAHHRSFQSSEYLVVCDRFVATEWVMSIYYNRVDEKILTRECKLIDDRLVNDEIVHVILLPSIETITARLEERGPGGRTWDMEPLAIHPLWRAANGVFSSSKIFPNETEEDRRQVIEYIVNQLVGKRENLPPHPISQLEGILP